MPAPKLNSSNAKRHTAKRTSEARSMNQRSKTTARKAPQQADGTRRKEPKRNRSVKRRPDNVPGLIVALREDTIDLRTREAQDVLALRDSLAQDPEPVVKGLIRDALAIDGVIMSRIAAELVRPGGTILDENGELHRLITKDWPDVRGGILKSGRALLAIEKGGQAPPDSSSEKDLTSLILEADQ